MLWRRLLANSREALAPTTEWCAVLFSRAKAWRQPMAPPFPPLLEQKEWWAVSLVPSYGASFGYGSPLRGWCQGLSAIAHHSTEFWCHTKSGAKLHFPYFFLYDTTTPSALITIELEEERVGRGEEIGGRGRKEEGERKEDRGREERGRGKCRRGEGRGELEGGRRGRRSRESEREEEKKRREEEERDKVRRVEEGGERLGKGKEEREKVEEEKGGDSSVIMGSQRTKGEDVHKIFTSVFITNFPDSFSAKELFKTCKIFWIRVKEVSGWAPDFSDSNDDLSDSDTESIEIKSNDGFFDKDNEAEEIPKAEDNEVEEVEEPVHGSIEKEHGTKVDFKEEASYSETKIEQVELFDIRSCWGNLTFEFVVGPLVGNSGGILCVWDSNMLHKENHTISDYFIAIMGKWLPNDKNLLIISVYAPQELSEKKMLWQYLVHVIEVWNGDVIVTGDFNELRTADERFGSIFNVRGAAAFNSFISYKVVGLRYLSDHRTILLRELRLDYGPTPFRFFHHWFELDGFDSFVSEVWKGINVQDSNDMLKLAKVKISKIEDLIKVKNEFLAHFKERFDSPCRNRLLLDMIFQNKLSTDQSSDLERPFSTEEVKGAVWDCGSNKSPGPDGFTFDFYRKFWSLLEEDVVAAVNHFFLHGYCQKGGNSSFIALIPKSPGAKLVKKIRPISLIGSLYKIIAKLLANRLVTVVGDLVNEVQYAFIANRQILDGPFILNEVINWCKARKKQSMIFKVDFEKAYDSVRWDFLDDILQNFGFGSRWRNWIQSYLKSSRGSILVNGSPTSEFQFYKGLKQGDPLSPLLFILVMESLHLSFHNVTTAGLFNVESLYYYTSSGLFFRASRLRIDLHKSKLIGIAVDSFLVDDATNKIGCMAIKLPFSYLGINIGDRMSRIKAWDNVINNVLRRLSKWKMKSLSIGGRLSLLKAVLGSPPLYYMSMFKVPIQVLKKLESICCHFFNGVDPNVQKMTFVKWNNVLASKEKGGLGVPRFYGLNRALIFQWIWRFRSQNNSLWSRVIKALHGADGALGSKPCYSSNSSEITQIIHSLQNKGMLDRWRWTLSGDGEFSVSSIRCFIGDKTLATVGPKTRWNKYVPSKVNILAWRIKHDFLPTCLNISRRGIELDSITCVSYNSATETTSHLFFSCPLVNLLYKNIARWWDVIMPEMSSYEEWWAWIFALRFESKKKKIFEGLDARRILIAAEANLSDEEASYHEDTSDSGTATNKPKQQQQQQQKVIQNGNSKKRISTRKDGVVRILPPVSVAEIHAIEKERKARTILLMEIPKEHLRRFHRMDDAKEIWEAIRTKFGELEAHGAEVSIEDANHKFLRSLPPVWSNLAITMRTKPDVDTLSIDDLYNNLRVFEQELTSTSNSSASAHNVAFVFTQQVHYLQVKFEREVPAGFADEVIYSLFAKQSEDMDLLHEDLEQIDDVDIEEIYILADSNVCSIRLKKFYK
ncbi:RNA-directed DNA polymerase, eukaryota [Tanacetum coccineum]